MADEVKQIEVEYTVEISLSLHVGGMLPYKCQLYEYPAGGGAPTPVGVEQTGEVLVVVGKVGQGILRRFAWSVSVASNEDADQTVDIAGRVHASAKLIGAATGTLVVKKPLQKAFVNVHVKGKTA
jgi:hypothetical protein